MKKIATIAAALGYGGWTLLANSLTEMAPSDPVILRAAVIQGSYAGFVTLANILVLELLYNRLKHYLSSTASSILALIATIALQYSLIVPVHIINQTPNIVLTLAPGFIIGIFFNGFYIHQHAKNNVAKDNHTE